MISALALLPIAFTLFLFLKRERLKFNLKDFKMSYGALIDEFKQDPF